MVRQVLGGLAAAAALAGGVEAQRSSRFAVVDESTITRTLEFAGRGDRTLDVRTINGAIRVSGSTGSAVEVSVRKVVRAETDADVYAAQRDVRLDFVDRTPRIEAIVLDHNGQVCGEPSDGDRDWRRTRYEVTFDFTIRVPRGVALRLCTVNGGDVLVEGTSGDFDVENVNGKITMDNVAGSGSVTTVNGPVTVSFTENPREASYFKTVNGNVTVTFAGTPDADLRMKTFNGGLFSDFDVQPLASVTTPERQQGRFIYRSNMFTSVRAGRGGPDLTFETLNGNVRLLLATR